MLQQGPARVVVGEALKTLTNEGNNSVLMKGVSAGLYRLTAYRRVKYCTYVCCANADGTRW